VGAIRMPRLARRLLLLTVAAASLALMLWIAAGAAGAAFREYGFHPETGEQAWRALAPRFGDANRCGTCHEPELAKLVSATHAGIGCQSCHGALAEHEEDELGGSVRTPDDEVCLRCHTAVVGQPVAFRSVVPDNHYVADCLACHDPHTGISQPPPVVLHPLERLPTCVTCHGPDGFMARLPRHPEASEDDRTCLLCHAEGRGPEQ
jgi:hypothetical protein